MKRPIARRRITGAARIAGRRRLPRRNAPLPRPLALLYRRSESAPLGAPAIRAADGRAVVLAPRLQIALHLSLTLICYRSGSSAASAPSDRAGRGPATHTPAAHTLRSTAGTAQAIHSRRLEKHCSTRTQVRAGPPPSSARPGAAEARGASPRHATMAAARGHAAAAAAGGAPSAAHPTARLRPAPFSAASQLQLADAARGHAQGAATGAAPSTTHPAAPVRPSGASAASAPSSAPATARRDALEAGRRPGPARARLASRAASVPARARLAFRAASVPARGAGPTQRPEALIGKAGASSPWPIRRPAVGTGSAPAASGTAAARAPLPAARPGSPAPSPPRQRATGAIARPRGITQGSGRSASSPSRALRQPLFALPAPAATAASPEAGQDGPAPAPPLYLTEKRPPPVRIASPAAFGSAWNAPPLDYRSSPPPPPRPEPRPAQAPPAAAALPPAPTIDLDAVSRDVISRIEKRLRVERERSGL